jgi:hypothetical protein
LARELYLKLGWVVVDGDSVRKAIGTFPIVPEREPEVWGHVAVMVCPLQEAG